MSVGVGLRVGTTVSSVAVTSPSPGRPDPDPIERRTAVHLHSDGTATLGEHHVVDGNTSSFTDFVDRLGRSNGVRANDGALSRAEDLVATAMECLIADAGTMIGDANYTVVASHPTDWPPSTVALLRNALDYVGLRHVSLISDAEAAAAWFESQVAHQTGRLVASYHIDPHGSTVTLVRSGVVAGKAFRFAEGDAPSVSAQLSTALGAFGWLVTNLDAIVVTLDETVDTSAAQIVAQSIKAGLGVRCALAPDPHQTMVRGAALAAAAGSVDLLGSTQVLPATRPTGPKRTDLDPETTAVIAKITPTAPPVATPADAGKSVGVANAASTAKVTPGKSTDAAGPDADIDDPEKKSKFGVWAAAAAVALIVGIGVLVFTLRDTSTANANPPTSTVPSAIVPTGTPLLPRSTSTTPTPSATTETSTTAEIEEAEYTAPGYVATNIPQTVAETSPTESSTTTEKNTSTTTAPTSSSTGWSRRNPPDEPSSGSGGGSGGSTSAPSQPSPEPTTSTEPSPDPTETVEPTETTAAPSEEATATTASPQI
ncbi:hypothetical protein MWU77_06440 [Rhodococcus sp. F64268]|uniref:hypothetical protein n=1 Tax=Rhodococcus sp. F64268 TaxID=2926402 RepID=UPI001FF61EB4|nr:hypothetical protein [Rhodococcus sp. F64268]MCK0090422.1 hypothetical protein [Rhodococcus sp. F64268]